MRRLKRQILKYKSEHGLSYRELAHLLRLENHQHLYKWLHTEPKREPFADKIEREFVRLPE
jgi:hypothetical protein